MSLCNKLSYRRNDNIMYDTTYLQLILGFCSTIELVKTFVFVSKWHYAYINSAKYSLTIRMLEREFGLKVSSLSQSKEKLAPVPIECIYRMHNYWNDNHLQPNFIEKMVVPSWSVYGLKYFLTHISNEYAIQLDLLSFNETTNVFEALSHHNQHIIHTLWRHKNDIKQSEIYLNLLYWFVTFNNYIIVANDIIIFYKHYNLLKNQQIKNKLIDLILDLIIWEDYQINELFEPFLEIAETMKPPSTNINISDDFNRDWPLWTESFIHYLLPDIIKYACTTININESTTSQFIIDNVFNMISDISDIIGQKQIFNIFESLLNINDNILHYIIHCNKVTYLNKKCNKYEYPLYKIFSKLIDIPITTSLSVENRSLLFGRHSHLFMFYDITIDPIARTFFYKYIIDIICNDNYGKNVKISAVNSLKRFCCEYRLETIPLSFVQSIYNIYTHSFDNDNKLSQKICITIIRSLMAIFTGLNDEITIRNSINCMIQIPFNCLSDLINKNGKQQSFGLICQIMKRISTVFKFYTLDKNKQHLSLELLLKFQPNLLKLLNDYNAQDDIMEQTIRCIKHVIRQCSLEYSQSVLYLSIFRIIINLYCNKSRRSSFLYLLSIYLDEYITDINILNIFSTSLYQITLTTFSIISSSSSFNENNELVEDFYEMIKVYMKKSTKYMFAHNFYSFKWIFELGIKNGLLMNDNQAHITITSFYQKFFNPNTNIDKIYTDKMYSKYLNIMIDTIFNGLSYQSNKLTEGQINDLLILFEYIYNYNKKYCQTLMLKKSIKIFNKVCECNSKKQRLDCLMDFYHANKQKN